MQFIVAFFAITLPWINPFSFGPTSTVVSLLFTWVCTGILSLAVLGGARAGSGWQLVSVGAAAWLVAASLSALIGLLQYFGVTTVFGPWVNYTGLGEAFANLRQRNHFATLTSIGLAAVLWWRAQHAAVDKPTKTLSHGEWLAALVLVAVLLAAGNAASSSRTGLLQFLLLSGMAWSWSKTSSAHGQTSARWLVLAAWLGYGVAACTLPSLAGLDLNTSGMLARLQEGDITCSSRLTLWSNVLHLIAQKPWLGWGWGELDYAHFITLYPETRFCEILDNAHNLPLHLAVELGVPVAIGVCAVIGWLVWRARPWSEMDATRQMAWAVLALIGVHSLLEYPLWYGPFQMAVVLCVFLLWRQPVRPPRGLVLSVAALILGFCSYAAWDYWRISQIYLPVESRARAYQTNTLEKIRGSWLFRDQVQFAELTTTPITAQNAAHMYALAKELLHFSPEPRVVQALINSARLLGREDEVQYYQARLKAAFPTAGP